MKKTNIYYSLSGIAIFTAILVFVNLISSYVFTRLDLSAGGIYSLSKSSKKIARNLPDRVIIKAFFSKNLSGQYAINRAYLQDLLAEYKTYSRGKIRYEFIDPLEKKDPRAMEEIQQMGIMPIRFQEIQRDKYEIKEGFMGIAFIYGDKKEVIPMVKSTEGLEYDITSRIKKLVSPGMKTVGFITGHGEIVDLGELTQYLMTQYNLKYIDTTKEKEIPDDVSCLVDAGPKKPLSEKEIFMIDQFLLKGKPVALLVDQFDVNTQSFWAQKSESGLDKFLEFYGIKTLPGFVLDLQCQKIAIRSQQGFFVMQHIVDSPPYPFAADLDRTNMIVKSMEGIAFPFISPVEITPKDNLEIKALAKSSKESWYNEGMNYVSPYTQYKPNKDDRRGPFNLAVTIVPKKDKTFTSFFADRSEKDLKKLTDKKDIIRQSQTLGRMLFIPNSAFVKEQGALFLNIVDWASQDEDLISIRAKGAAFRPLKKISDFSRILFKYTAILFVPVLLIGYGLFRWNLRRAARNNLKNIYA